MVLLYFNRHFMRAQENWSLSLRDDVKAGLSERALTMLGFRVTNTLGGVQGSMEGKLVERPKEAGWGVAGVIVAASRENTLSSRTARRARPRPGDRAVTLGPGSSLRYARDDAELYDLLN